MQIPQRIKLRRDSTLNWASEDPVLADGEPGYDRDLGVLKIGNGIHRWSMLSGYSPDTASAGVALPPELLAHINSLNPHPAYDDGPSLFLLYENAKV